MSRKGEGGVEGGLGGKVTGVEGWDDAFVFGPEELALVLGVFGRGAVLLVWGVGVHVDEADVEQRRCFWRRGVGKTTGLYENEK